MSLHRSVTQLQQRWMHLYNTTRHTYIAWLLGPDRNPAPGVCSPQTLSVALCVRREFLWLVYGAAEYLVSFPIRFF